MKIETNLDKCEGLGMCEAMSHEFFEVGDDGFVTVLQEPGEENRKEVLAAVDACPVLALKLVG